MCLAYVEYKVGGGKNGCKSEKAKTRNKNHKTRCSVKVCSSVLIIVRKILVKNSSTYRKNLILRKPSFQLSYDYYDMKYRENILMEPLKSEYE